MADEISWDIAALLELTHCGPRGTCTSVNYAIVGSDNGFSSARHQAIIWINAGLLLIEPYETNFDDIWSKIQYFFAKVSEFKKWWLQNGEHFYSDSVWLLSGVPDYFDRNKISSGGDLSH